MEQDKTKPSLQLPEININVELIGLPQNNPGLPEYKEEKLEVKQKPEQVVIKKKSPPIEKFAIDDPKSPWNTLIKRLYPSEEEKKAFSKRSKLRINIGMLGD